MVTLTLISRFIVWVLSLACIGFWVRFAIRKPQHKHLAFAVLGWCGHVVLFYLIVTINGIDKLVLNLWATGIMLHVLSLVFTGGLLLGEKE